MKLLFPILFVIGLLASGCHHHNPTTIPGHDPHGPGNSENAPGHNKHDKQHD